MNPTPPWLLGLLAALSALLASGAVREVALPGSTESARSVAGLLARQAVAIRRVPLLSEVVVHGHGGAA